MDDLDLVRRLGLLTETVHSVVYFAPEPPAAYVELGLRGYWRGYFASRAAPLGPVGPELVTALFGGFAPDMVARAIPEVWTVAPPERVVEVRVRAVTATLRRLFGAGAEDAVRAAGELLARCVDALPLPGRPMAAALVGLPRPVDPVAALWHDCTVLREHRGDGHLVAVATSGLVWPEPHLLKGDAVDERQREYRGWDEHTWEEARRRVRGHPAEDLERETDRLAAPAYTALDPAERRTLARLLEPLAHAAAAALPYPNAMGLPAVT